MTATGPAVEDLLRDLAPRVLGALVRRLGHFDLAEDAVQEALLAAATSWPTAGLPDSPRGWLITVAHRRLTDRLRSDQARRRREDVVAARAGADALVAPAADVARAGSADDSLLLLLLCCHPALTTASQVALTLRAVGGLTTGEIAAAFLVPEATMAQRISRAKRRLADHGARFTLPEGEELLRRLGAVLHVLYLAFNEGYTATAGDDLHRPDLAAEAIRLTRLLHRHRPDDGEVTGLLALMLLTDARRDARTGPRGELVPLAEQDRALWDRAAIAEGVALISDALARLPPGPYQLQAAIAAVHAEAADDETTDWRQILALYDLLAGLVDNPVVTLNRAVAVAKVHGPAAGLRVLAALDDDPRLAAHHRLPAVRAHLLEALGDHAAAEEQYRLAARGTLSVPERRYLQGRAARAATGP